MVLGVIGTASASGIPEGFDISTGEESAAGQTDSKVLLTYRSPSTLHPLW